MKHRIEAILSIIVLSVALPASAQSIVVGTVVDDSGAALPGATLVVTDKEGGHAREATTDRTGAFSVPGVREGTVRIHVELAGFQPADVELAVASRQPAPLTIRLKVGFDDEVTVVGDASESVLAPSRNADAIEFDPEAIRALPTDAQDLQSLVENFSAAVPAGGASVVVDGVETDAAGIPASAIHRLILNRNPYSTEFAGPGRSRVEVETERGSRRFYHGSGALFLRNSALQARNAFATSTPDMTRGLGEGTLGGPLPAKGWSFFLSGQHLVDNDSAVVNAQTVAGAFVRSVETPERRTTAFGRVDFRPNKTAALTVRYDLFDDVERNHGVGGLRLPDQAYTTVERRHRVQANDHRILSSGVLNDARVEATSSRRTDGALPHAPATVVAGAFIGGPSQTFSGNEAVSVQAQEIATMTVAAHTVRAGARLKARWNDVTDASNFGGTYQFQSLADVVRGRPFLFVQRGGNPSVSYSTTEGDVFAETTVRPAGSVGVTAGLRYEWQSRVGDWNNVAPRVAVAFAPGDRRTVVRAGAGVFYQSLPQDAIARALLFDDGGLREIAIERPRFPVPPASSARAPGVTWTLAPALQAPRAVQSSIGVERTLWRKTSVSAEYLFINTTGALRARDVNAPLPGSGVRPDRSRLNVFEIGSTGESRTNAATLTFRGRLAGFRGTIQYTLSKTIDDGSNAFDLPADSLTGAGELGRADFDRRHRLNVAGTYGWMKDRLRLGGVLAMMSGAPFDILTGTDSNGDLVVNDRPAGVARNAGDGPGFTQLDLRFTTVFRAPRPPSQDPQSAKRDQTDNLELNVDLFNAFNQVNATTYIGVLTSPLFGKANAARMARTAQVSLRYRF